MFVKSKIHIDAGSAENSHSSESSSDSCSGESATEIQPKASLGKRKSKSNKKKYPKQDNSRSGEEGNGDAFSAYLSFQSKSSEPQHSASEKLTYPLDDLQPLAPLIHALGKQFQWKRSEIISDIKQLDSLRLRHVRDLRFYPKKGWKGIPLNPLVGDLLRSIVWQGISKSDIKKKNEEFLSNAMQDLNLVLQSTTLTSDSDSDTSTSRNDLPIIPQSSAQFSEGTSGEIKDVNQLLKSFLFDGNDGPSWVPPKLDPILSLPESNGPEASLSIEKEAKQADIRAEDFAPIELVHTLLKTDCMVIPEPSIDTNISEKEVTKGRPILGIVPSNPSRIRVADSSGKVYEIDRYCPHKQYDMLKAPGVRGTIITCPKHNWDFDLTRNGACTKRPGKSLHCRAIDW
jgi:nitrite reductase/ring-hydroxylating ferredoxin subunit